MNNKPMVVAVAGALGIAGCVTLNGSDHSVKVEPLVRITHGGADAKYRVGRYLQGQQRYQEAITAYMSAIASDPRHADAHNALAILYSTLGDSDRADRHFAAAIAIHPKSAYLHVNFAHHYLRTGRAEQAVVAFKLAATLDPASARAREGWVLANRALGSSTNGDIDVPPVGTLDVSAGVAHEARQDAPSATPVAVMPASAQTSVTRYTATYEVTVARETAPVHEAAPAVIELTAQMSEPGARKVDRESARAVVSGAEAERRVQAVADIIAHAVPPDRSKIEKAVQPKTLPKPFTEARTPAANKVTISFGIDSQQMRGATSERIEISNANGWTGLARRTSLALDPSGPRVFRLTNSRPFGRELSRIEYVAGTEAIAAQLHRRMNGAVPLVLVKPVHAHSSVRLVLGKDYMMTTPRPPEVVVQARGTGALDVAAEPQL